MAADPAGPTTTFAGGEEMWLYFDQAIQQERAGKNRAYVVAHLQAEQARRVPNRAHTV
jgi:hypothetical protein